MLGKLSAFLKRYRHRLCALGVIILSTLMSLGLVTVRWLLIGWRYERFLIWDLFLAWMPMWLALAIYILHLRGSKNHRALLWLGAAWLAFFPNAPYLLTEFVHLGRGRDSAWWYDLLLTIGMAWNGLILGLMSLYCVQQVVCARLGGRQSWWLVGATLFLASIGVSLGRFDRLNSWDLLRRPFRLVSCVINQFLFPASYFKPFATAVLLCGFLSLSYLAFWTLVCLKDDEAVERKKIDSPT